MAIDHRGPPDGRYSNAEFTSRIPYAETRGYVNNVLTASDSKVQSGAPTPTTTSLAAQTKASPVPTETLDWKAAPAFADVKGLDDAITQEVKGGGSPTLRQWFAKLGLNTAEAQKSFVLEQRRILLSTPKNTKG